MKYLVGIDEGTGSCKTCIFDQLGNIVSMSTREYPSYYPENGYVEQNIHEIELNVFDTCKEAIQKAGINNNDIAGVSFSNQGISLVLLDKNENPVNPFIVGWQDLRHVEILEQIRKEIDEDAYFKTSGMPFGTYNTAVLRWLQKYDPERWSKVEHICSHQDYFLRKLGADGFYIDEGSANFMSMLEVTSREWDTGLLKIFNVRKEQLSTIVHDPGKVVGHVTEEIALKSGLPVGCKVCIGGLDTNCCTLAAGGVKPGMEVMVVGTAGVSTFISEKLVFDAKQRITTRSNPGNSTWQLYSMTNTAASSFRWFRDELCSLEIATSKLIGIDPYEIITNIAKNSKPGANGVSALICLQGSHVRRKNENARGSFLGITLGTNKADIAHAILEGICFEMYDIMLLTEEVGSKVERVRLCGGITKSPMWCQMFADILNVPVELTEITEMGSLGAAMYAGIGVGMFANCPDAVDKFVKIKKMYMPNMKNKEAYAESFKRWNKAYDVLNKSYYL